MSWQRRWAERLLVIAVVGPLNGLVTERVYASSHFSAETTGILSILAGLPFIAVIRWLVGDQRRRNLESQGTARVARRRP